MSVQSLHSLPRDKWLPPYRRIEKVLRERISVGTWPPGTRIPSRKELSVEFAVAIATLERAIGLLLADGALEARGARGTFVADPVPESDVSDPFLSRSDRHALFLDAPGSRKLSRLPLQANITAGIIGAYRMYGDGQAAAWFRAVAQPIEQVFAAAGGTTCAVNRCLNGSMASMENAIDLLAAEGVDAVCVVLCDEADEIAQAADAANKRGLPIVFVTSYPLSQSLAHVYYDNQEAGYLAVKHLTDAGCQRLAFVNPFQTAWALDRVAGARSGATCIVDISAQLHVLDPSTSDISPIDPLDIVEEAEDANTPWRKVAREASSRLFENPGEYDGVITANDAIACELLSIGHGKGIDAGRDYALIGFDDGPRSRLVGLSSIRPPLKELGEEAGRAIRLLLNGEQSGIQAKLKPCIVRRRSTSIDR